VSPGERYSRRPFAIAIVAGAVAILGLGIVLDLWAQSTAWGLALLLLILLVPVALRIRPRSRKPSTRSRSPTRRELISATGTIVAGAILVTWMTQAVGSIRIVASIVGVLAVPASLYTLERDRLRRLEGRPMSGLQLTASVVFLAILLPVLILMSLFIALLLVCLVTGPPSFH
jgi:hypothetical protein